MKKITLLAVLLLLSIPAIYCQLDINRIDSLMQDCQKQVAAIDNMILYKALLDDSGYKLGNENDVNEWLTVLYFDRNGTLRKSKLKYFFVGDEGWYIRYYNDDGIAIHSLFYSFSAMNSGYSASRHLTNDGHLLQVNFINRDDDRGGQIIEQIVRTGGYNLPMPLIDGVVYDKVINIDSLKNEIKRLHNTNSLYKPNQTRQVKFMPPQKGDTTFISQNGVMLYSKPNCTCVSIVNICDGVIITKAEKNWYKIKSLYNKFDGYIHSSYLAPVEKLMK